MSIAIHAFNIPWVKKNVTEAVEINVPLQEKGPAIAGPFQLRLSQAWV